MAGCFVHPNDAWRIGGWVPWSSKNGMQKQSHFKKVTELSLLSFPSFVFLMPETCYPAGISTCLLWWIKKCTRQLLIADSYLPIDLFLWLDHLRLLSDPSSLLLLRWVRTKKPRLNISMSEWQCLSAGDTRAHTHTHTHTHTHIHTHTQNQCRCIFRGMEL